MCSVSLMAFNYTTCQLLHPENKNIWFPNLRSPLVNGWLSLKQCEVYECLPFVFCCFIIIIVTLRASELPSEILSQIAEHLLTKDILAEQQYDLFQCLPNLVHIDLGHKNLNIIN
ncbi:hypothetical protein J3Q64DRAFT_1704647 [Phycomyces blakesleeanus]|uniref:Uncharacterized protein n=2 Tax=Phycomyces blakesleeanus TaxID=4837 RepID=A0A167RFJ2_PHYB8|nr:hypothetical protein PHYBLDRAFT_73424 [Phycomyces blakesleeanus NRRL 1555(-)]OAD81537.1 hypothetical protein PHYBLDRAFT_73424 [Phycomyces blakesleeanus NRRL 1555(-)]|eukprot:XP_018299577.1 hypothetical protein PHYBLDRAFT_73424 [Phycomyces blakesleeanus NRRL 1555(-)]